MGRITTLRAPRKAYKLVRGVFMRKVSLGYSKIYIKALAVLEIPRGALLRHGDASRRWRVDQAKVIDIQPLSKQQYIKHDADPLTHFCGYRSVMNEHFIYTIGRHVRPLKPFDMDPESRSGYGIHCFASAKDAKTYDWQTNEYASTTGPDIK